MLSFVLFSIPLYESFSFLPPHNLYLWRIINFHFNIIGLYDIVSIKIDSYRSGFSDYCLFCYIHNVLANMSPGLQQVFVELGSLNRTSNHVLYLIHGVACSDSISITIISAKYSSIVTHLPSGLNLRPLDDCLFRKLGEPTPITVTPCVLLDT